MASYPPAAAAPTPAGSGPCSRVELSISCSKLRDMDVFSKSDPIVAVYTRSHGQSKYTEVGLD